MWVTKKVLNKYLVHCTFSLWITFMFCEVLVLYIVLDINSWLTKRKSNCTFVFFYVILSKYVYLSVIYVLFYWW